MMEELYEIKQELARGNQGVVRLCTHKASGQDFACKSTFLESSSAGRGLLTTPPCRRGDPSSYARAEAATLSALRAHPNVVFLHALFEEESSFHLILELCRGGDLLTHVSWLQSQKRGDLASTSCLEDGDTPPLPPPHLPSLDHASTSCRDNGDAESPPHPPPPHSLPSDWLLTESQVAEIFFAALRAVAFCHGRGIMHGDIKMENLLLPCEGCNYTEIKLADFGFASEFWDLSGQRKMVYRGRGTLPYMAPEMLKARPYDEKADIWSLGVLLFFLLCWQYPFQGKTRQEVLNAMDKLQYPNWEQYVPSPIASPLVKDILKKMLVADPMARHPACFLLSHPWLKEHHLAGPQPTSDKIDQPPLDLSDVPSIGDIETAVQPLCSIDLSQMASTCTTVG
ncbi:hypothetical protein L7F22_034350 [Adiantum nelumboides]|nr:hypothetical protein [Adiantum nelumboides]